MQIKDSVLQVLEEHKGSTISGAEIARQLSVSRAAVWKAIEELRQSGYPIDAVTRRGYCLSPASDLLSPQGIFGCLQQLAVNSTEHGIENGFPGADQMCDLIHTYPLLDSTNQEAKRLAADGAPHGTLVVAEEQSAGRGRLGRSFFSPRGCGIYLSLLVRPSCIGLTTADTVLLTTASSVAVARAVSQVLHKELDIKWVNDLYFQGKKVCGILTEGVADMETGTIDSVIIGIGVNYKEPPEGYPQELRPIVTALLTAEEGDRCRCKNLLTAAVCRQLLTMLSEIPSREFLQEYKERSLILGRPITVISTQGSREATALDFTRDGGLKVRFDDGSETTLTTGEISIRPVAGQHF